MKKNHTLLLAIGACIALTTGFSSCIPNGGNITIMGTSGTIMKPSEEHSEKDFSVKNFAKISMITPFDLYYTQDDEYSVKVKGPKNFVDALLISAEDGELSISAPDSSNSIVSKNYNFIFDRENTCQIYVSGPTLRDINLISSGTMYIGNLKTADELDISMAGSGSIYMDDVVCTHMEIAVAGSGDVKIKSIETSDLKTNVAGSGDIEIKKADVEGDIKANIAGSGDLAILKIQSLKVKASIAGSGDITLSGDAHEAEYNIFGSGDIHAGNLKLETKAQKKVCGSGDITTND